MPTFTLSNILDEIQPYLHKSTIIGILPGTGGAEFFTRNLIEAGYTIFGTDRVPCIARLHKYGKYIRQFKKVSKTLRIS